MLHLYEGPVLGHITNYRRRKSPAHGGNQTHNLIVMRHAVYLPAATAARHQTNLLPTRPPQQPQSYRDKFFQKFLSQSVASEKIERTKKAFVLFSCSTINQKTALRHFISHESLGSLRHPSAVSALDGTSLGSGLKAHTTHTLTGLVNKKMLRSLFPSRCQDKLSLLCQLKTLHPTGFAESFALHQMDSIDCHLSLA